MADATVLGQVISGGAVLIAFGGLYYQGKAARTKAEEKAEERANQIKSAIENNRQDFLDFKSEVADKFSKIDVKTSDFMPKGEIRLALEHLRDNRVQAEGQVIRLVDSLAERVGKVEVASGRADERIAAMGGSLAEIKNDVKDIDHKIDRLLQRP